MCVPAPHRGQPDLQREETIVYPVYIIGALLAGGSGGRAIEALQAFPDEAEIHIAIDQAQQVIFWNLLLQPEVVEQRFCA